MTDQVGLIVSIGGLPGAPAILPMDSLEEPNCKATSRKRFEAFSDLEVINRWASVSNCNFIAHFVVFALRLPFIANPTRA